MRRLCGFLQGSGATDQVSWAAGKDKPRGPWQSTSGILRWVELGLLVLFISGSSYAATSFYVEVNRSSNGDGSAANPWNVTSGGMGWNSVSNSLLTGDVKVYLSSRSVDTASGGWTIRTCG